jgi:hypothetical protein
MSGNFREKAEKHWAFIEKLLTTYTEEENKKTVRIETCHFLYVEAMVHGYKHALQINGDSLTKSQEK